MNNSDEVDLAIANRITFSGQLESTLSRHTGLICWTTPESSPVFGVKDNGTFCFIRTHQKRFLLTCSHIWRGFQKDKANGLSLWISLTDRKIPGTPAFPFLVNNPKLIDEDVRLDLATIEFDEIDKLEAGFFYYLSKPSKRRLVEGNPACFVAYTGDGVRLGNNVGVLHYSLFTLTVSQSSFTKFLLHDPVGSRHLIDNAGNEIPPIKMGGASGSPVFSFDPNLKTIWLAGTICEISSPGLTSENNCARYERSDGNFYATHADFIQTDGTIRAS